MRPESEKLFAEALALTPGGVHSPVRALSHVKTTPLYVESAKGAHIWDVDGNQYIDFCQSFGPHLFGHRPPELMTAVASQLEKGTSYGACHPLEIKLCSKIKAAYPFADKVRLVNSGTEAVMTAIRIARGATGRSKVLKFEGCYHGHSDGLLVKAGSGVSGLSESSSKGVAENIAQDTLTACYDNLDEVVKVIKTHGNDLAAVILEPVPANCGLWVPEKQHIAAVMDAAKSVGALVLFDEVITGFRIAKGGVCELFDLKPDLVTLGKIIGGGLPLAAVAGSAAAMDNLAPLGGVYQAGTLSSNPLATAAGSAVLDRIDSNPPYEELKNRTTAFVEELREAMSGEAAFEIRQFGSLFWFCFGDPTTAFPPTLSDSACQKYAHFFQRALENGVYLPPSPYEVAFVSTEHNASVLEDATTKLKQCLT